MRKKDKRGVELSLNVVIIAILVILVLVVVAVFFTGGFTNLANKIKGIFGSQLIDLSEARLQCNSWCSQYSVSSSETIKEKFCDARFDLDLDGDGQIDDDARNVRCYGDLINVECNNIDCLGI